MILVSRISTVLKIEEDKFTDTGRALADLHAGLRWQQAIGRPDTKRDLVVKVLFNVLAVVITIRNAVILGVPDLSEWTREQVLGNILEQLGYNNSRMFYMTAVTFGSSLLLGQVLFEAAEYGSKQRKQFLEDVFGLEQLIPGWNMSPRQVTVLRQKLVILIRTSRLMAFTGVAVAVILIFVALVLRLRESRTVVQMLIACSWFLILSLYTLRLTTVFFHAMAIFAVSVITINSRYASLNAKLRENARDEHQLLHFMREHGEVTRCCKQYNRTYKWMILSFNNLSAPAVAAGVYNVVYGTFTSRWEHVNAVAFCFMVTACTIMSIFIPSGTSTIARASYPLLMSCTMKVRMCTRTRMRLLTFCKRMSESRIPGEIGFSNGDLEIFTRATAAAFLLNLMGTWFLYAEVRQNA